MYLTCIGFAYGHGPVVFGRTRAGKNRENTGKFSGSLTAKPGKLGLMEGERLLATPTTFEQTQIRK